MSDKYGIKFLVVPVQDVYLFTTPVPANAKVPLIAAPAAPNCRIEVVSIDVVCNGVLAIDASNTVLVNTIVFHDASADGDTTIFTGGAGDKGDLKTAVLDLDEAYNLYNGVQSLDPGDSIHAVLATTTPDTAGLGYAFIVGYRVKEYSGQ